MSTFLPEKGALFLHVPRTGGTWLKHALNLAEIPLNKWGSVAEDYRPKKHTFLSHYRLELLSQVKFVFSFVRHPIPYYVSVWRFTTRCVLMHKERMEQVFRGEDSSALNEAVNRWKPDFFEWMEEMLEEEPGWVTRWFERYIGPEGGEHQHYIGRTETLEKDVFHVIRLLGYEDKWMAAKDKIDRIIHAKNRVRPDKAPRAVMPSILKRKVERSERVVIRRFFSESTREKRIYRNMKGIPV